MRGGGDARGLRVPCEGAAVGESGPGEGRGAVGAGETASRDGGGVAAEGLRTGGEEGIHDVDRATAISLSARRRAWQERYGGLSPPAPSRPVAACVIYRPRLSQPGPASQLPCILRTIREYIHY